jgi:hypothetical protein
MANPSVRFEMGDYYWVAERESVGFTGTTNLGLVEFLITSEALTQLLDPDRDTLDSETALGSGLVDQSQKMTVAARAMADKKTVGHLS